MIKKMSYIKLKTFKQNVPSNYQSNVLFSKLPYLANIKIPAFQNFVIDVIDNRTDLQKFLLATIILDGIYRKVCIQQLGMVN